MWSPPKDVCNVPQHRDRFWHHDENPPNSLTTQYRKVPAVSLISGKKCRTRPYNSLPDQITAMMAEAPRFSSSYGLRGWTYSTPPDYVSAPNRFDEKMSISVRRSLPCCAETMTSRSVPMVTCATALQGSGVDVTPHMLRHSRPQLFQNRVDRTVMRSGSTTRASNQAY